jgi:CHAT domain-containing protein
MHGKWELSGVENGLVLTDDKMLAPTVVKGMDLTRRPFVFLNACQVGSGEEMLGDYAGMAEAFLYAGACAVVAPLWSIDDKIARSIALRFYERTFAEVSPAEALREERLAAPAPGEISSSTCLAYQFFGHPTMRVRHSPA